MRNKLALVALALGGSLIAGCSSSSSAPGPASSGSPSSTPTPTATSSSAAFFNTLANLRNLATAEETYYADNNGRYTTDSSGLEGEGFTREPGTDAEVILIGIQPTKGYCLVGGATAQGPWVIYDSQLHGGFVHALFHTSSAAEAKCSHLTVSGYTPLA